MTRPARRTVAVSPRVAGALLGMRPHPLRVAILRGELPRLHCRGRLLVVVPQPTRGENLPIISAGSTADEKRARPAGGDVPTGLDRRSRLGVNESASRGLTPWTPSSMGPARHG
jgi:hypothetical protein